ncbi:MAG: hypothetical protein M0042_15315 [Nitrospiraceae bacterium]|nr:hypothetical protein [Nitrospiraceae bacterium]
MGKKDEEMFIIRQYRMRQTRQIVAIALSLFLVLLLAVVYKRPDRFGEFQKQTIFGLQVIVIAAFISYSLYNWRCPSCSAFLKSDIGRRHCKKCGARLQ